MATLTTPEDHLASLEAPRRAEMEALDRLIRETLPDLECGFAGGMLGYGPYHYRYASGREGDASLISLASRKAGISLYVLCTDAGTYLTERYAARLGKVSVGKSCVRFKSTQHVDLDVLRELLAEAGRLGPPAAH